MTDYLYLRNPTTGETKAMPVGEARRYQSYGWVSIPRAEFDRIQQEYAALMMRRSLGPTKHREH